MTPSALTAEELASVANAVTGRNTIIEAGIVFTVIDGTKPKGWFQEVWDPSITGNDWIRRHQALAILEYLIDGIGIQTSGAALRAKLFHHVRLRDITALCRMVLELKEQA